MAAELGWPIELLLEMPAKEIERLGIVAEAWQDWMTEQVNQLTRENEHG